MIATPHKAHVPEPHDDDDYRLNSNMLLDEDYDEEIDVNPEFYGDDFEDEEDEDELDEYDDEDDFDDEDEF